MDLQEKKKEEEKKEEEEEIHSCPYETVAETPIYWFAENPLQFQYLSKTFPILLIENFVSQEACNRIIEYARPLIQPSTVVIDHKVVVDHPIRSSQTAYIKDDSQEDLQGIKIRIAALSGYPIEHIEGLGITFYQVDQYYRQHHDYFAEPSQNKGSSGERIYTFLIYLNDVKEENQGKTSFPHLNVSVQPKQGVCIFWPNSTRDGTHVFEETLHEAETLKGGEKIVLNIWVRQFSMKS